MPRFRKRMRGRRRFGRKKLLRSDGISGYVGKRSMFNKRMVPRRKVGRIMNFGKRVRRAVEDQLLEKANLHILSITRVNAAANSQATSQIQIQNSSGDLAGIYNQIKGPVAGGQPSSTLKSMKFTVTSYLLNIAMKNQTQANVIVDLYELVPRFDAVNNAATLFTNGFMDQGTAGLDTVWGTTPFMNNVFCTTFKILRKMRYLLGPGASEIVEYRDSKNYEIEYERIISNSSNTYFKNWSKLFFVIVRGEPTNDATTKTNVGTVLASVDFVMSETYFYTFAAQNVVQSITTGSLSTVATPDSVLLQTAAIVNPAVA